MAGPSAGRARVLARRFSRSPQPTRIKDENTPSGSTSPFADREDAIPPRSTAPQRSY